MDTCLIERPYSTLRMLQQDICTQHMDPAYVRYCHYVLYGTYREATCIHRKRLPRYKIRNLSSSGGGVLSEPRKSLLTK